jgi:hypothetical protein
MTVNNGLLNFSNTGNLTANALWIGNTAGSRGRVDIQTGNKLTTYANNDRYGVVLGDNGGAGAMYQNGGVVDINAAASINNFMIGKSSGSFGHYGLDNGYLELTEFGIGSSGGGNGVLEVRGGTIKTTDYFLVGRGDSGTGQTGVVNLVGLLSEKGAQTFSGVQSKGAETIAEAAKAAGVTRFVQISAIGANSKSNATKTTTKTNQNNTVNATNRVATTNAGDPFPAYTTANRPAKQHVDRTHVGHHLGATGGAGFEIGHVDLHRIDLVSLCLHLFQPACRLRVARRIADHHLVAHVRELGRDRFAQPAHATGHQCHSLRHTVLRCLR